MPDQRIEQIETHLNQLMRDAVEALDKKGPQKEGKPDVGCIKDEKDNSKNRRALKLTLRTQISEYLDKEVKEAKLELGLDFSDWKKELDGAMLPYKDALADTFRQILKQDQHGKVGPKDINLTNEAHRLLTKATTLPQPHALNPNLAMGVVGGGVPELPPLPIGDNGELRGEYNGPCG